MYKPVKAIEVRLWGSDRRRGGPRSPDWATMPLSTPPRFCNSGIEPAPLTMPSATARDPYVFTDLPELTFKRLPAMLADASAG